ncbi:hypothetical protein [Flavobacterium beibuense]|uniref:hypothetical protein n=1 Tax=Flavobacterium beibuense TaxID=657326 RepID=UPI003A933EB7
MEKLFALLAETAAHPESKNWHFTYTGYNNSIKILHFPNTIRSKPIEATFWIDSQKGIDAACKFITDHFKKEKLCR